MKRTIAVLVALFVSAPLFASEGARRYLVATRGRAPRAISLRTIDGEVVQREVTPFRSVDGYAAELTEAQLDELRKSPDVRFIEPDVERHAIEDRELVRPGLAGAADFRDGRIATGTVTAQSIPWGIDLVHAPAVWSVARGAAIRVGIVDSGIDSLHPELQGRYRGGYDFVDNDAVPQDGNGHGTHVAGTIAAADDSVGVVGVAPAADIYALRVLDDTGSGTTSNVIRAIDWAIENGMNVLNLSLGSSIDSVLERQAFQRAADAGILAIAAAGNDGQAAVGYPAAYPSVVAIGAIDASLSLAGFSNIGPELAVVAPGVGVRSTYPRGWSTVSTVELNGFSLTANPLVQSGGGDVSGPFVYLGLGRAEDMKSAVNGNIALIQRGELTFAEKARNAATAGARAVIIFDNVPNGDSSNWTLGTEPFPWPLTVGISLEDGQTLLDNANASIHLSTHTDDFATLSGTSMATPHVAGAAALLWSVVPGATASQVRSALLSTARDLGDPGFDTSYGNGLVDVLAAATSLAPVRFNHPVRRLRSRGRH